MPALLGSTPIPSADWHVLDLGDGILAQEPLARIRARLADLHAVAEAGSVTAFVRHESEGRLHCSVLVYFPPGSGMLAMEFGASPCRAPLAIETLAQMESK